MNRFYDINKVLGVCFGIALVCFGIWKGLGMAGDARRDAMKTAHTRFEKGLQKRLRESAASLPPGLNGEYPANGPMADYYRHHKAGDVWVPVAPH